MSFSLLVAASIIITPHQPLPEVKPQQETLQHPDGPNRPSCGDPHTERTRGKRCQPTSITPQSQPLHDNGPTGVACQEPQFSLSSDGTSVQRCQDGTQHFFDEDGRKIITIPAPVEREPATEELQILY